MGLLRLIGVGRFFDHLVDKGVLYAKDSLGKDGVPFRAYKIRTMFHGADRRHIMLGKNCFIDENGNHSFDDQRVPKRCWLRRWGLDEWPQIYNILEGEMGFVGTRPREEYYWTQLEERRPGYQARALQFKPGLMPAERTCANTGNLDDFIDRSMQYLDEKEQRPILTDVKYAAKILWARYARGVHGE